MHGRSCWTLSGLGLRIAQEMGAHRRSRYNTGSRAEGELLKRSFWAFTALVRLTAVKRNLRLTLVSRTPY